MKYLKQFTELSSKKPHGLSEGYWRVLPILRVVLSVPLVLIALGCFVGMIFSPYPYSRSGLFMATLSLLILAAVVFFKGPIIVGEIVRLFAWVRDGFSEDSKK